MITKISEIKIPKKCPKCGNYEIDIETGTVVRSSYTNGKFNSRTHMALELRIECSNCGIVDEVEEK